MEGKARKINHLKTTTSAIRSIIEKFEALGWSVEPVEDEASRFSRHTVISPDSTQSLSMMGGKVYRHPGYVEQICRRKHLTKRLLDIDGVPTPAGGDFSPKEREIAAAFFDKLPKPTVIKPTDSGGSQGVSVGVRNRSEFDAAWTNALADSRSASNVLVEQFVRGVELRAFVVGDEVVSVVARIQPYVIGDGHSRIGGLLEELHELRKIHYRALKMPVEVDWNFVDLQGHDESSVPSTGEIVFLNPFNLPTVGAFIVDVSDSVCEGIKDMSKNAKQSIPLLEIAGVDILVEDLKDAKTAYVLEVNTAASLELHRYPTHGKPRTVDNDIVNYFHHEYLNGTVRSHVTG